MSSITSFDFLSLFDSNSKHYHAMIKLIKRYDEDVEYVNRKVFTNYIYKKAVKGSQSREKRILLITSSAMYHLSKKLSVIL
jgi:hypothetical protein